MDNIHIRDHAVKQELYDPIRLFYLVSDTCGHSIVTRDGLLASYIPDRIRMKKGDPYPLPQSTSVPITA